MIYPTYEAETTNRHIDGLTKALAAQDIELVPLESRKSDRINASIMLGKLCRLSARNDRKHKNEEKAAIRDLRQKEALDTPHNLYIDMLAFKTSPNYVRSAQQALHAHFVERLKEPKPQAGIRTEEIAMTLLSRYAHPWLIALPALPHHEDNTQGADIFHYDISLSARDSEFAGSEHFLQVKTYCLGRCGNEPRQPIADRYDHSIQLVSGCCDLGIGSYPEDWDTVTDNLIAEFDGVGDDDQIKYLDVLTDNLLFNITADLLPRGELNAPLYGQLGGLVIK